MFKVANSINIQDYIITLKDTIDSIYKKENLNIIITINTHNINLNIDEAIPLGLILNNGPRSFTSPFEFLFGW